MNLLHLKVNWNGKTKLSYGWSAPVLVHNFGAYLSETYCELKYNNLIRCLFDYMYTRRQSMDREIGLGNRVLTSMYPSDNDWMLIVVLLTGSVWEDDCWVKAQKRYFVYSSIYTSFGQNSPENMLYVFESKIEEYG